MNRWHIIVNIYHHEVVCGFVVWIFKIWDTFLESQKWQKCCNWVGITGSDRFSGFKVNNSGFLHYQILLTGIEESKSYFDKSILTFLSKDCFHWLRNIDKEWIFWFTYKFYRNHFSLCHENKGNIYFPGCLVSIHNTRIYYDVFKYCTLDKVHTQAPYCSSVIKLINAISL